MSVDSPDSIRRQVEQYLSNKDLEIELVDINNEYTIVYSTNILAQESDDISKLTRNYWINQNKNGGQISSPWGSYEHEQQCSLLANLLIFAKYKIKGISNGWKMTCKKCCHVDQGPIWRNSPKSCEKCGTQFAADDKAKTLLS
jgi:hypothetical protein